MDNQTELPPPLQQHYPDLTYTSVTGELCCSCHEDYLRLNKYGYCADCFKELDPQEISNIRGTPIQINTITKHYPTPGLTKTTIIAAITATITTILITIITTAILYHKATQQ